MGKKHTICQEGGKSRSNSNRNRQERKSEARTRAKHYHEKITVTVLIEDKARVTTLPLSTARKVSLRWVYSSTHSPAGPRTHTGENSQFVSVFSDPIPEISLYVEVSETNTTMDDKKINKN